MPSSQRLSSQQPLLFRITAVISIVVFNIIPPSSLAFTPTILPTPHHHHHHHRLQRRRRNISFVSPTIPLLHLKKRRQQLKWQKCPSFSSSIHTLQAISRKSTPNDDDSTSSPSRHFIHRILSAPRRRRHHLFLRRNNILKTSSSSSSSSSFNDSEKAPTKQTPRPDWACDWMPTWLITMRPLTQLVVGMLIYVFHLSVLTQYDVSFPFQLIPNDRGYFQSIGLDSIAGIISLFGLIHLRRTTRHRPTPAIPPLLHVDPTPTSSSPSHLPWHKLYDMKDQVISPAVRAFTYLLIAYSFTGRFSAVCEQVLYIAAGLGLPLTIAMHRSLTVLLGHLSWVGMGCSILRLELGRRFFSLVPRWGTKTTTTTTEEDQGIWYRNEWNSYWLWWVIGGYFVSSWIFNISDVLNRFLLPSSVFDAAGEGVVAQLIAPENNDKWASVVGYVAPCLSAPWWEEVLYRGFMLPALCLVMKFWPSVIVSGLVFSAHHMSATGFIPLMMLGVTWAVLYATCGNLLVTILIHGMWNSRVFLGSWLGL